MSDLPQTGLSLPPRGTSRGPTTGSAALWVLLLLVVLLGFVGYLWWVPVSSTPDSGPSPVIHTPAESRQPQNSTPRFQPDLAPEERVEATPNQPTAGPVRADEGDRFRGRGSLRGSVDTTIGDDFPATWTLVLEPSKALMGSEAALTKRFEYTANQRDFEIPDLPLAGYAVRAEAPGYNGLPVHVLLERTSSSAYVMLQLGPAGFLTGQLTDSSGVPLEGIEVWLYAGLPPAFGQAGSGGRKTTTLADGTYRFDAVLDGPQALLFGAPLAPMMPALELQFRAPSLTVPTPKFPPLASLDIMIVDDSGQPIMGAALRGSGSQGGAFDLETPPDGLLRLRHLVPGHYRFTASHQDFGEGRLERRFEGGEDQAEVIVLVRRP